jgi:WD40 repeat protein
MNTRTRTTAPSILLFCLITFAAGVWSPSRAQYFGQNKIQYERFKFEVLKTEHFDIYFYPEEKQSIEYVGRVAERWYHRYSRFMQYELKGRQPLIIYASHPQFEQTNAISGLLGEGTGGVTEALKRRIVLPFSGPLGDTDHVVGHELVHAFQYDIANRGSGRLRMPVMMRVPLWFVEGMAEYYSLGSLDPHTAMWIRDAARNDKLPSFSQLDNPRFFPYRYGQAFLAYIGGRFGDDKIAELFDASGESDVRRMIRRVLGVGPDSLVADWHAAVHAEYDTLLHATQEPTEYGSLLISKDHNGGELNIAPVLSPDGNELIFFSEKDLFSINLFLADAHTGEIEHTIIQTERDPHLESMQFINSAGAWDPDGKRVAFATVTRGRPVLGILDVDRRIITRRIPFESLGEILNPSWSPDGRRVAFSALAGGYTDLFIYDLESGRLDRITEDPYTDIQPQWSPDGSCLVFVTDRFSANLETLDTGHLELALLYPDSARIERLHAFDRGKHINPVWSPDGRSIYFVSDFGGISNIFRMEVAGGRLFRLTNLYTGVSGITPNSPALSSAMQADRLVYCAFEKGQYNIYAIDDPGKLAGTALSDSMSVAVSYDSSGAAVSPAQLPPPDRSTSEVLAYLAAPGGARVSEAQFKVVPYKARFSLDYIGQPYLVGGVSSYGTQLGGGISMFWSDMLGNNNLGTALQVQSNGSFTDVGFILGYENGRNRRNWGATLQQIPYSYDSFASGFGVVAGKDSYIEEVLTSRQTVRGIAAYTEYPFSVVNRMEFLAGYENISFDLKLNTFAQDLETGAILVNETRDLPSPSALNLGYGNIAYVYDFSYYGATSPILGQRYRLDVGPVFGSLSYYTVLTDYRRYLLPKRPFTLAFRVLHYGRYGGDAESDRLFSLFIGYESLVRGYDSASFDPGECASSDSTGCPVYEQLFGSRMGIANVELRFPPLSLLHLGSGYYGWLPLETAIFFDAGVAWTRSDKATFLGGDRDIVKSYGVALRLGLSRYFVFDFDFVNPIDRPNKGWHWQFSITPGF